MNLEDLDKRLVERVKPWALVLGRLRHRVPSDAKTPFGTMLKEECVREGVDYPPADIEETILILIFRWAASGAPAPKEELV